MTKTSHQKFWREKYKFLRKWPKNCKKTNSWKM